MKEDEIRRLQKQERNYEKLKRVSTKAYVLMDNVKRGVPIKPKELERTLMLFELHGCHP